jgi:hypothetical protein
MEIIYMYYSSEYDEKLNRTDPCIFKHEEYDNYMKNFVTGCHI